MSNTPRTDEAQFGTGRVSVDFARKLERELNAANAEVERLTAKVAQLYKGAEEQKQRIKRLEEAGDELICHLSHNIKTDHSDPIWHSASIKWGKVKKEAKL